MGLSVSWIASRGLELAEMLDALGPADSGDRRRLPPVPAPAKLFAFELEGWRFVASEDSRFASRERVVAVSQGGDAFGALIWSAQHDCNHGLDHLDVWGDPPAALDEIHKRLLDQMQTNDEVDFVFDAPIELAASLCGFNPDTFDSELDLIGIKVVRKELMKLVDQPLSAGAAPAQSSAPAERKPGFLARLFGGGRDIDTIIGASTTSATSSGVRRSGRNRA